MSDMELELDDKQNKKFMMTKYDNGTIAVLRDIACVFSVF